MFKAAMETPEQCVKSIHNKDTKTTLKLPSGVLIFHL